MFHSYRLEIADDGFGAGKTIEFDAEDTAGALYIVSRWEPGRHAELWEGFNFICTISQDDAGDGIWLVEPSRHTG